MDLCRYENTAAWLEYCDGMSRFAAETEAARRQGFKRHEVTNAIRNGHSERARHHREAGTGNAANDLPRVQSAPKEEKRSVSFRDVQAGRGASVLPSLRLEDGGVV